MNVKIDQVRKMMKTYFGYDRFKEGQEEIITEVLKGNDVLGILPTGTGKSLCYQLPALLTEGVTVVVSPLISLMVDQVKQLRMRGIKNVTYLNSMMSREERITILRRLSFYKMIYCSPEMLQNTYFIEQLKRLRIALFAVDEAHCISQWGYEFRTDYLRLGHVLNQLNNPAVLALSATATPEVQEDIICQLRRPNMLKIIYPMDRENIVLDVEMYRTSQEKTDRMVSLLKRFSVPAMIYFSSKKVCEQIAYKLQNALPQLSVVHYHGGMEKEDRLYVQQQFMNDQIDVVCCTSAFGMGIDKANVRLIIHFHIPTHIEAYIQEAGRAGRDGGTSVSLILYSPGDEEIPFHLITEELPDERQVDLTATFMEKHFNQQLDEQFEHDVMEQVQINEIQWGFIKYQLETYGLIRQNRSKLNKTEWENIRPAILRILEERKQLKQKQLFNLLAYIQEKGCRRKKLYDMFQDHFKKPLTFCCDRCDFTFDRWRPAIVEKKSNRGNWEQTLKQIFHQGG
ncbi:ATP-dependent DNA helicase RecQ [Melghiribacillus thermohalophilus]|uniref:ATP-dependent DNA helicase RecQ n=1 Tax=Melghiribacillus thermohalophilus TaxID=1324956 RepID=A0A4R3NB73_9BACI|nr:ATP-dependent DNA helicase RecQ [Melghiribacillus thermohalophilus]TCT25609.1 ATP-dependent DNA helicase RecQ [Melghiribacillus thermohalophilus]